MEAPEAVCDTVAVALRVNAWELEGVSETVTEGLGVEESEPLRVGVPVSEGEEVTEEVGDKVFDTDDVKVPLGVKVAVGDVVATCDGVAVGVSPAETDCDGDCVGVTVDEVVIDTVTVMDCEFVCAELPD